MLRAPNMEELSKRLRRRVGRPGRMKEATYRWSSDGHSGRRSFSASGGEGDVDRVKELRRR